MLKAPVNAFESEATPQYFKNQSEVILRRRAYGGQGDACELAGALGLR